jgi:hypothetical protein
MGCGASKGSAYAAGSDGNKAIDELRSELQSMRAELTRLAAAVQQTGGETGRDTAFDKHVSKGISAAPGPERAAFLEKKWLPFVAELKAEMLATQTRLVSGVSGSEVLPAQAKMREWVVRNLELTKEWHGKANISTLYEFMIGAPPPPGRPTLWADNSRGPLTWRIPSHPLTDPPHSLQTH